MIELLTPGTVWSRTVKGKTLETTVIGVTNTHLVGKRAEENPPQVIFVDSKGRWSSMDAARYMRSRTFETTNTVVAENVTTLFEQKVAQEDPSPITAAMKAGTLPEPKHVITLGDVEYDISNVLIAYNQRPDFVTKAVIHELILAEDLVVEGGDHDGLSLLASLPERVSFNIGGGNIEANNLGVYPLLSGGESMITLYLAEVSTEAEQGEEQQELTTDVPEELEQEVENEEVSQEPPVQEVVVSEQAETPEVQTEASTQITTEAEHVEVVAPQVTVTQQEEPKESEQETPSTPTQIEAPKQETAEPQTFQEKLKAAIQPN